MVVRALVAASLLAHVFGSQQTTVKLPAPYHTAKDFVAYSPSQNSSTPLPLVIMLSGYCLPAKLQDDMQLQYVRLVDEKRFHYVPLKSAQSTRNCSLCPTTIRAATAAGNMPFYAAGARLTDALTSAGMCTAWDATEACCINGNAGRNGGDTGYITSVIAAASSSMAIDTKRIYIVGIANGGFLAARLACDMPQLFAGVIVYAAGFDAARCTVPARVPVLLMQGDADVIVPFNGGVNSAGIAFPGFNSSVASWAARNQCQSSTQRFFNVTGGGARDDKYTVQATDFSGCISDAPVAAWRIEGGQHFALQATSAVLFGKALAWLMSR